MQGKLQVSAKLPIIFLVPSMSVPAAKEASLVQIVVRPYLGPEGPDNRVLRFLIVADISYVGYYLGDYTDDWVLGPLGVRLTRTVETVIPPPQTP